MPDYVRKTRQSIQAIKWTGTNQTEVRNFLSDDFVAFVLQRVAFETIMGVNTVGPGDYIVKGYKGFVYGETAENFERVYEPTT